jgi:hypothetical protein
MMEITLLILHGLLAVLLLGALIHQVLSGYKSRAGDVTFFSSVMSTRGSLYTNAVVVLYPLITIVGAIIYAYYRMEVRPFLEASHHRSAIGIFELKEHFIAIGFGLLPAYWLLWQQSENSFARRAVTIIITATALWGFFVGHILNNLHGLGRGL